MKNLSQISGMPQMLAAFSGWMQPITLDKATQTNTNGLISTAYTSVLFVGTIQPLSPKQIVLKPEGQRAWTWLQIHCRLPGVLETNDVIVWQGRNYKVMARLDYALNGFLEYHLVTDYQ